ncbi:MAG TPA: hypothetical protein VFS84_18070 [Candidatus Binatia bacterium]|nr:hypothetical protein [Candidatus Binatia bacterium]
MNPKNLQPIDHSRHSQVGYHDIKVVNVPDQFESFFSALRFKNVVTVDLEKKHHITAGQRVVFNEENSRGHHFLFIQ